MKDNDSLIKWFIILFTPIGWGWLILKLFSSIFGLTLDAADIIKNIPTEKEKKLQRKQKKLYFEKIKKKPLVELDQEGLKYRHIDIKIKSKYTQENADELAKIKYIYRLKYKRPLICDDEKWYSRFNECKTKHPENYRQKTISIMELFTSEERKYLEEYQKEKEKEKEHRNKRLEEMKKRLEEMKKRVK